MSESAAEAAEGNASDQDAAARDARVLRLGAGGCGRAEIAAALGMSPAALAAREAGDAALAAALDEAAGLALAWREKIAREAYEAGRFNFVAAWTRERRERFGDSAVGSDGEGRAPGRGRAGLRRFGVEPPRATYRLPCNGMEKLNPDGTCPCGAYHDDDYWRAVDAAWRAESPENAETPTQDEIDDAADDDDDGFGDDDNGRFENDEQL
jgi:hypothetical protein